MTLFGCDTLQDKITITDMKRRFLDWITYESRLIFLVLHTFGVEQSGRIFKSLEGCSALQNLAKLDVNLQNI